MDTECYLSQCMLMCIVGMDDGTSDRQSVGDYNGQFNGLIYL